MTSENNHSKQASIRFRQGDFESLRNRLLADLSRECFAVLLGKREEVAGLTVITVHEVRFPNNWDYRDQSLAHLSLQPEFVYDLLCQITNRKDVDTIVDVHTHPFSSGGVAFSGVDDHDEHEFFRFLADTFDAIHFGSIVLSQSDYSARLWLRDEKHIVQLAANVRTQTALEAWRSSSEDYRPNPSEYLSQESYLHRAALALGVDALERMTDGQRIVIVGLGGIGSVIAENLIHMGFRDLALVDPDTLERSNLSRVVGSTVNAVEQGKRKVDCIRDHLLAICPRAQIDTYPLDVHDASLDPVIAEANWVIVATDNHRSRFRIQRACFRFFVPFLSAGVNITVADSIVTDVSGEVILVRCGDHHCLNCLGRLNPLKMEVERNPAAYVATDLINRGYVSGENIKQPAVKTLNAIIASLAVDTLINQYTGRQANHPVLVYESNLQATIYPDEESLRSRNKDCFSCGF
jgi:molybdopterin/thiamine biosynthesis adenylyltransferase